MSATVLDILGGEQLVHNSLKTNLDYSSLVEEGLPKKSLLEVQKYLLKNLNELANLTGMSSRNLSRYTELDKLPEKASEAVLQLAQIISRGLEVFGDENTFRTWLHEPNGAIEGKKPEELISNRFGAQLVLDILSRIEWGVYS